MLSLSVSAFQNFFFVEMFSHPFMARAFVIAMLISVMAPLVGNVAVLRRQAGVGDALSHAGLAGVAIGLCLNASPVMAAVVVSLLCALLMELLRKAFPRYAEITPAVVMSLGVGLAAVFSGFVKKGADFNAFLFGSIVAVPDGEAATIAVLCAVVMAVMFLLRKEIFYIIFDEEGAKAAGVPVAAVNVAFTALTAVTVASASRSVGALIISGLMTVPPACAQLISKSFANQTALSVAFSAAFTFFGMCLSYALNLKPGGAIILLGVFTLIVLALTTRKARI